MVKRIERLRIFANGLCVRWVSLWRNSGAQKLMQMTYFFRFCVQLSCFFFIYFNQNDYGFSEDFGSPCRLGRNGGWKKKEFSQLTFASTDIILYARLMHNIIMMMFFFFHRLFYSFDGQIFVSFTNILHSPKKNMKKQA